jgi:DNA primase
VVALAQFDIRCAVATLGTACGEEHIQLAFRHVPELVFCFDGDSAGRAAARRALEAALPQMQDGRSLRFLLLPEGEDPDTLVRQIGGERFQQLIEQQARPLEDFLFDLLGEGLELQTMDGRARLSKLAAPLLDCLPAGVYRQLMFQQLAKRTGLEQEILQEIIAAEKARAAPAQTRPALHQAEQIQAQPPSRARSPLPAPRSSLPVNDRGSGQYRLPAERMLIALLLHHPQLAQNIGDTTEFRCSEHADLVLFAELVELLRERPDYNLNQLLGYWRAHHGAESCDLLARLAASQLVCGARQMAQTDDKLEYDPQAEFADCLRRMDQTAEKRRSRALLEQLKNGGGELSPEQRELLGNWRRRDH